MCPGVRLYPREEEMCWRILLSITSGSASSLIEIILSSGRWSCPLGEFFPLSLCFLPVCLQQFSLLSPLWEMACCLLFFFSTSLNLNKHFPQVPSYSSHFVCVRCWDHPCLNPGDWWLLRDVLTVLITNCWFCHNGWLRQFHFFPLHGAECLPIVTYVLDFKVLEFLLPMVEVKNWVRKTAPVPCVL